MSVSAKIKRVDNKMEQNKDQYYLDRQTAKTFALSSENVSKYDFLTSEGVFPEKDLLEKAAALKRFEYSPLDKELKKQTNVAEKQYQKLDNAFESNKRKEVKKSNNNKKSHAKSNLLYNKLSLIVYCIYHKKH